MNVSILIPTHNRANKLERAIKSVRALFNDIEIIIGDNSSILDQQQKNYYTSKKYNCKYLDLLKYEADIYYVYLCMLIAAKTPYVFILEDDDILINLNVHLLAQKIISKHNCVVSFNIIDNHQNKLLYSNRMFKTTSIDDIPIFWNGQYQMGVSYYNRQCLIHAINVWCNPSNILNFSNDECLTLLCINQMKKYIHIPFIGSIIDKTDSISISKEWSIFACRQYIDIISDILHINKNTVERWKQIQLKELSDLCGTNVCYDDVYNNYKLMDVEKYIVTQLKYKKLSIIRQEATILLQNILNI